MTREQQKRIAELLQAKSRLENYLNNKRRETALACAIAKKQEQQKIAKMIDKVIPSPNGNYLKASGRALAYDIKKVLKDYL
jgi:hypothetical protein